MKKTLTHILLMLLVLGALAACGKSSTPLATQVATVHPAATTSGGYPYPAPQETPAFLNSQIYPGPDNPTEVPTENPFPASIDVPTPASDLGVITGQLKSAEEDKPYLGLLILARAVYAKETGVPPMIAYSDTDDPKAVQDVTGKFVFADIKPGVYAIVLWNPGGGTVLMNKDQQGHLLVTVEANKVTDLGVVTIK
jgi:hypothetical protein